MIAVLLMTCGRLAYTRRTLDTFSAQNPDARERFLLLHGDDASPEPEMLPLAAAHGFETVIANEHRRGARAMRAGLIAAAAKRGAEWVLVLENDWEWAKPFPWALFEHLKNAPDVYCLRLYGAFKGRDRKYPCWQVHAGQGRRAVTWQRVPDAPEPTEIASIHWGAPPAVTRIAEAQQICVMPPQPVFEGGDSHEMAVSGKIRARVARVVDNVVYHIGTETTAAPGARKVRSAATPERYTPEWQRGRRWTQNGSAACFEIALRTLGLPASVLDVGCAEGHLVTAAAARGVEAVGVDMSLAPSDSGALRHADLRQPLQLDRVFEMVICWEVAEHLPAEAAATLCDSLVRHLAPGGTLLFTAATPGQGGDGHLNEAPTAFWRELLEARGLAFQRAETTDLSRAFSKVAPRTPWYGKNLQVFRAPHSAEQLLDPAETFPRVAVTIRTADRSPNPNYVGDTVRRLLRQGIRPDAIQICATDPDVRWLERELAGAPVTVHVPTRRLTPNENGLAQIRNLQPDRYDWVLLLEDDLAFCADFIGSVKRWLVDAARQDRTLYRFFTFRTGHAPSHRASFEVSLKGMCGTQAVALRMADALDFLAWADANLETWGGFRGNAKIAFDKLMGSWAETRWPGVPGVVSSPFFVRHMGKVSSIHPRTAHMDTFFAGERWRYRSGVRA